MVDKKNRKVSDIPLKFAIELEKMDYKPREQLNVRCKIRNLGGEAISLIVLPIRDLTIYFQHDNKIVCVGLRLFIDEYARKDDIIMIKPNESYEFTKLISDRVYAIPEKVGSYKLYLVYSNWLSKLRGVKLWTGEIKSNVVSFNLIK